PHRLIPRDPDPQPIIAKLGQRRTRIGVQVLFTERLRLPHPSPLFALLRQIEPRREHLERLSVVEPPSDDRPEHRRERVPRHPQPVSPRPILPSLVDQTLTNIKHNRTNHTTHLTSEGIPRTSL